MNADANSVSALSIPATLQAAGLAPEIAESWHATNPSATGDLADDLMRFSRFWTLSVHLVGRLPQKAARTPQQVAAAVAISRQAQGTRDRFLALHVEAIYARLTSNFSRFVRLEDLVYAAADAYPGLTPTRARIASEDDLLQSEKDGFEIDQGVFLSHVLGHEKAGRHLCHAMLLPRVDTKEYLVQLDADGALDLGAVSVNRRGKAIHLTMKNPRFLNAEDQTTIDAMETAVDIAILDPATDIAVVRGDVVTHTKYAGRRIFGAGINLTHLYRGKIPFLWYLQRDLGFVHKFLRGVARPDSLPDDEHGRGIEKPWIAAVDTFAIGGHCQILLTMDYTIAAHDAYLTLPARKEGIIPGAANLRLPRFTGDRIARQAIQYGRRLDCDSVEGRLVCDEIVPANDMDAAIDRVVSGLTDSGAVGAIGNRRGFRVAQEPLDLFRSYMAVYAREQASCHFSPALIVNLEQYWDAQNRKG